MCGIIGYIGNDQATDILMDGLKRLEYRGYDSAGVVVLDDHGSLVMCKQLGRIHNLDESLKKNPLFGRIGIGHTRWATHGEPSEFNAHPHCDCSATIALVHNGIIENYQELKISLLTTGHAFSSSTDSEVVVHLLEDAITKDGLDLVSAVRHVIQKIRGTFAFGVLHSKNPDCLIAVRRESPLIIGLGQGDNFIASDVSAILSRTKKVVYLKDDHIAIVRKNSLQIIDPHGQEVAYEVDEVQWKLEEAEKVGYENFMLKEIHEQPDVVRRLINVYKKPDNSIVFDHLKSDHNFIQNLRRIYIVACGTAYYAGLTGRYILSDLTGIPVEIDLASEFRYRNFSLEKESWVIAVSQSGETADTLASIRKAKKLGSRVLAIVNVVGSTLAREADDVIYTQAGPEIGVASTKAYVAQLGIFHLLGLFLGKSRGQLQDDQYLSKIRTLETVSDKIVQTLKLENQIRFLAKEFVHHKSALYIGRGFNYPNAMEGALKNKEISYMHAEGYAAGEMKHGPIALIDDNFLVVGLCTAGSTFEKMVSNLKEVHARKGRIILIANHSNEPLASIAEHIIEVPEVPEDLSPIINVIPLQLLAYYLALERGSDIDKPRNLAKSVTVE